MKRKLSIAFVVVALLGLLSIATGQPEPNDPPLRVLFIGNSYTALIRPTLVKMLAQSPYKASTFEFITKGGATLHRHLANEKTLEQIRTGKWDYVVLQDQSQTPALPGRAAKSFHTSVDALTEIIRSSGAEPVLFSTWGYRDGDSRNKKLFPDYDTMQREISTAYQSAAERNRNLIARVGVAWWIVRNENDALGTQLYRKDGAHPSPMGAYLASSVILQTLFQTPFDLPGIQSMLSDPDRRTFEQAVSKVFKEAN